jgi:hypothetical protein
MAFSTKITATDSDGSSALDIEVPWWDDHELRRDPRFDESEENRGYLDYRASLSAQEVQELSDRYRTGLSDRIDLETGKLSYEGWHRAQRQLEAALKQPGLSYSVWVFEWESGM